MGMKTPLIMKDPEELEKEYAKIASADTAKIVNEEDTDRLRDRRQMHGGVDGNTNYKRPGTGVRTLADKQSKPKPHPTKKSAIETVAAELRARYGGSAVIGGSLKKKES